MHLATTRPSRSRPARCARGRAALGALGVALCALGAGCSSDEAGGTVLADARQGAPRPEPAVIATPAAPYREIEVRDGGRVAGTVQVAGRLPRDTTVHPTMDVRVCGRSFVDRTYTHSGDRLGGAVVWLEDIRAGRALPMRRRFEVTNDDCQLEPRVQAVLAGGTLNVRSADAVVHRTRVLRQRTGEILARYEQNDAGEVIPDDDVLATPGLLELRSEVHPWTRGYIAVFDHPYFAVTAANGQFTFTDVPPGTYTLAAWHERYGRIERQVTVTAGGTAVAPLVFGETGTVADDNAAINAAAADTAITTTGSAARSTAGRARGTGQGQ
ncbi:MAG TPA: carboxypeptidase regulatory-like domain-containing protein [Gemmatimonadaceae bacterium]|nr:carboxypeptidase regulatory-like domain-containing protein [Gemmatimonadaceae bacterium]